MIRPGHHHLAAEGSNRIRDPRIVGGNNYPGEKIDPERPFDHMLDHRFPVD
jgi:hypothetical protein